MCGLKTPPTPPPPTPQKKKKKRAELSAKFWICANSFSECVFLRLKAVLRDRKAHGLKAEKKVFCGFDCMNNAEALGCIVLVWGGGGGAP